jgi:RNA polymerase sigma factor (sigma-70 family)
MARKRLVKTKQEIEELTLPHIDLADKIARMNQSKYPYFSYDELQSVAYMGLVKAANQYNKNQNTKFSTFAFSKINWSIVQYAILESKRLPTVQIDPDSEELSMSSCDYDKSEFYNILLRVLDKREKEIFLDYYVNGKRMHQIADTLELDESRISQIISGIVRKIQCRWRHRELELYERAA